MFVVSFDIWPMPPNPAAVIGNAIKLVPAVVARDVPVDLTWKKHCLPTTLNLPVMVRDVAVANETVTEPLLGQGSHLS